MHNLGEHYLSETIKQNQKNILNTISSSALESIITEDVASLDTIISELLQSNPTIHSLNISNEESKPLAKLTRKNKVSEEFLFEHSEAIKYGGETFGYINIRWNLTKNLTETEEHLKKITVFTSSMLMLLAVITTFLLHMLVIRPMRGIENRLLGHATGESNGSKKYSSSREFNQLSYTISKLESLTISKDELQKEVAIRKNAQIELAKARDEALKASRSKSSFLANMSHELRTPLNAIIGYSEIIAEEAEDNEHDIYLQDANKINNAGKHLLELISDILDLSKIESGKMELSVKTINLPNLIDSITDTVSPLVEKNSNKLEVIWPENIGEIQNDDVKLKQVILNLLSNACKFTKQGVISLKMQRLVYKNSDWITFSVEDTGIGISSENQKKIFESFSQADNSTSREYGGSGLGLAISRNFCLLMNGDLQVESEPGKGSCFTIKIPAIVGLVQEKKIRETKTQSLPLLTADQIRFNNTSNKVNDSEDRRKNVSRVFLIEPNIEQGENIKLILETEGLVVDCEADLDIAYEKIIKTVPNILVINTDPMKEESLTLLQQIKSDIKLKNITIIAIVKDMLSEYFFDAGVRYQLPLRYDMNELLEKMKLSLRKIR